MHQQEILINLLPVDPDRGIVKRLVIAYIVITLLLISGVWYLHRAQQAELSRLHLQQNRLQKEFLAHKKVEVAQQKTLILKQQINNKKAEIKEAAGNGIPASAILDEVEKALPADMVLIGLEFNAKQLVLTGFTDDQEQIAVLLAGLRANSRFNKVVLTGSQLDKKTGEIQFTVESDWGKRP